MVVPDLISSSRSRNMAAIRGKDTLPELTVRRMLHGLGLRFRLHCRNLPGRPDIVLPRHRTVVLVHGCFWHRHEGCRYTTTPKTRLEFWQAKFDANVARDHRTRIALEEMGWRVLVVWECELLDAEALRDRLKAAFAPPGRKPRSGTAGPRRQSRAAAGS
jgi:DNA mismatch endonuclease (patch repair protein)